MINRHNLGHREIRALDRHALKRGRHARRTRRHAPGRGHDGARVGEHGTTAFVRQGKSRRRVEVRVDDPALPKPRGRDGLDAEDEPVVPDRARPISGCAHRLWLVCDRYRSLLGEIEDGLLDRASILQRRDELSAQVHAAYDQTFSLDQQAYESVRQPPENGSRDPDSRNESQDEILPTSLQSDGDTHLGKDPVPH